MLPKVTSHLGFLLLFWDPGRGEWKEVAQEERAGRGWSAAADGPGPVRACSSAARRAGLPGLGSPVALAWPGAGSSAGHRPCSTNCCPGSAPRPPKGGAAVTATHGALDLQAALPLLSQEGQPPLLPRGHFRCDMSGRELLQAGRAWLGALARGS